jgi:prolyl oligopeptidase
MGDAEVEETPMNRVLLIGTLALMLSATVQTPGGEPDDPYQWLEEVLGEKALAWVKERNAESMRELTGSEQFRALDRRILEILDSDARIPAIQKIGPYYYNFWRDAKNPRGLWRRTAPGEYRKAKPNWETVLNLDALGQEENVHWVWHGAETLKPEHKLALVSLSRGGADASVVREFDLSAKSFVRGGYSLPEAKSQISWRGPESEARRRPRQNRQARRCHGNLPSRMAAAPTAV